jgi:DNA-binding transcriptional MerR regulator
MEKSAEAFRTISEVSEALDTPAHVLRFWESRFTQIKPLKRAGGRRYYRPGDVALLAGIRQLLHDDGLTIRGVQKILREKGVRHVAALSSAAAFDAPGFDAPDAGAADEAPAPVRAAAPQPAAPQPAMRPEPPAAPSLPADLFTAPFAEAMPASPPIPEPAPEPAPSRSPAAAEPAPVAGSGSDAGLHAEREPAATLLRAMDALRAREKKPELVQVFQRLTALRDRLRSLN